ncbi:hypothetical protein P1J78_12555 [Psychromarinibacter sp. C21-152]|uniref:Uncharacterized protein n=1 Tax=Psychromarinibacter sediminicola TaxID=3033385 RepID=A0AAE3T977_9RHOB|nr:hypothetical protein [Psychromarinibacter sediminicola]MDF0601568.1 hypothetical protein [Psychromarinibacter sediminicola]
MTRTSDIDRLRSPDGHWIGPEKLQEILAEGGYSAGQREQFLKAVLTELTRRDAERPGGDRAALLEEVRTILSNEQGKTDQTPISDDTL